MTNTTNNNNSKITTNSMKWDTDEIFEAHFMYPTEHFKDADELSNLDEEVFSSMMISMIELLPPLSEPEQQGLKKAVLSGNRLRTYYLILKLVSHYADSLAETQVTHESLSTSESLERKGYQIESSEAL